MIDATINPRNESAVPEFSRRKGPATCSDCLHFKYDTCGRCGQRARKVAEKAAMREQFESQAHEGLKEREK